MSGVSIAETVGALKGGSFMAQTTHTWQEIASQPRVWLATIDKFVAERTALQGFLSQTKFEQILTVGCGSTHYLAQAAAASMAMRTGVPARAYPSSELWLYPASEPMDRSLLVAISRSGSTTETLYAVDRFRELGGESVLAVTNYPESPLAAQADFVLDAPEGQEQSVAQTRSFTSMLLLTQALTATMMNDEGMLASLHQLGGKLSDLVDRAGDLPQRLGADLDIQRLFFLGGGHLYGIACEAMLKTKEMTLSTAEAYHPLEFRHGPMSVVDANTLVVGLVSDTAPTEEAKVLADMKGLGARILALSEDSSAFDDWRPDDVVELRSDLDQVCRQPLYLPVLQRLAYHRALAKGLDPDRPTNLTAVVEL
jgi:glucosamine--fructose-6-phosphate aminotransferase (isomerizing)